MRFVRLRDHFFPLQVPALFVCSSVYGFHGWILLFLCLSFPDVHSSASLRCLLFLIKFLVYGGCIHNVFPSESRSES